MCILIPLDSLFHVFVVGQTRSSFRESVAPRGVSARSSFRESVVLPGEVKHQVVWNEVMWSRTLSSCRESVAPRGV